MQHFGTGASKNIKSYLRYRLYIHLAYLLQTLEFIEVYVQVQSTRFQKTTRRTSAALWIPVCSYRSDDRSGILFHSSFLLSTKSRTFSSALFCACGGCSGNPLAPRLKSSGYFFAISF